VVLKISHIYGKNIIQYSHKQKLLFIKVTIQKFFAHVQTGPEAHPASCTMGTGSFPGVKRPGSGADHPPPSSAEVKKE
jgi:hypothetical protein